MPTTQTRRVIATDDPLHSMLGAWSPKVSLARWSWFRVPRLALVAIGPGILTAAIQTPVLRSAIGRLTVANDRALTALVAVPSFGLHGATILASPLASFCS